jgi:murein DD-endopeptidase MepM/ murein hydrolase activator NlpD
MLGVPGVLFNARNKVVSWFAVITAVGCLAVAGCSPPAPSTIVFPIYPKTQAWTPGTWSQDQGVDITAPCGTRLVAVASGRVIREGMSGFGPYAPQLLIDSGPLAGRMVYYGHVQRVFVRTGTHVNAGQVIAQVGTLGYSFGCHLEIGISRPRSAALPSWHATSAEMLRLLDLAYLR